MNDLQSQEVNELTEVLSLKNTPGWNRIVKDAQNAFDGVSVSWYNFSDGTPELIQARVSAISNRYIIDLMALYESRMNDVGLEVISKEENSTIQINDVEVENIDQEDE